MAGVAVLSLCISVIGSCVAPSTLLRLARLLGDDSGAVIAVVLIGAAIIYAAIYALLLWSRR